MFIKRCAATGGALRNTMMSKWLVPALALLATAQAANFGKEFNFVEPQIVGGVEATPHQFPWQAGLFLNFDDGSQAFCGGSLISPDWVLTAGHCADDVVSFDVILGAQYIRNKESSQQRFKSYEKHIHEKYNSLTIKNDIALIKLPTSAVLNEYVQVLSLPTKSLKKTHFTKEMGTMSGWGLASDSSSTISPVLRYVSTPIVSNAYCALRYTRPSMWLSNNNICVSGKNGRGTCNGDSGGPLTVFDSKSNKNILVGVTSFGISLGCEVGWPGAFTRVTSYLTWISKKTGIEIEK